MTNDPDNPPLTGKEVWMPWRDRFLPKAAEHRARWLARQTKDVVTIPAGSSVEQIFALMLEKSDPEIAAIQARMRANGIAFNLAKGMTQAQAEAATDAELNSPPHHPLPTFDEL